LIALQKEKKKEKEKKADYSSETEKPKEKQKRRTVPLCGRDTPFEFLNKGHVAGQSRGDIGIVELRGGRVGGSGRVLGKRSNEERRETGKHSMRRGETTNEIRRMET
jgi:hypothetical protein